MKFCQVGWLTVILVRTVQVDALAAFGGVASMATGLLPPELRGIAGSVADIALAASNQKKGFMEIVMDGTDYPWCCLCATPAQVKQLSAQGTPINAAQCPEDPKFGCRQPQMDMSSAPLPQPPTATSSR